MPELAVGSSAIDGGLTEVSAEKLFGSGWASTMKARISLSLRMDSSPQLNAAREEFRVSRGSRYRVDEIDVTAFATRIVRRLGRRSRRCRTDTSETSATS